MTRMHRDNLAALIAVIISLLLHVSILVPAFTALMSRENTYLKQVDAQLESTRPPASQDDLQLGLQKSEVSSLTWVGYDEYIEHLAEVSETEQAAFTEDPQGNIPVEAAVPTPQGSPHDDTQAPVEETSQASASSLEADTPDEVTDETPPVPAFEASPEIDTLLTKTPVEPATDDAVALDDLAHEADTAPETPQRAQSNEPLPRSEPGDKPLPDPPTQKDDAASDTDTEHQHERKATTPPARGRPEQAQDTDREAQPRGKPTDREGDPADRESPATSIIEVEREDFKQGKPIAGKGLELFPKRLRFDIWTRLTRRPAYNPQCIIEFDRTGKVPRARIVTSSGDDEIDSVLLSSLYGWRARGKEINALTGDDTVPISIRILLR